jgi:hypothetical protein
VVEVVQIPLAVLAEARAAAAVALMDSSMLVLQVVVQVLQDKEIMEVRVSEPPQLAIIGQLEVVAAVRLALVVLLLNLLVETLELPQLIFLHGA